MLELQRAEEAGGEEEMSYNVNITQDEDGNYIAYIPELDCYGDGSTAALAVQDVLEVAENLHALQRGEIE
jgi:predicted RNase H-like HicB family nuclease